MTFKATTQTLVQNGRPASGPVTYIYGDDPPKTAYVIGPAVTVT